MTETGNQHSAGEALHDLFREVFELHGALSKILDKVHEEAGLSTPQLRIMRILEHIGPSTVPDIAARLGVSRQFVQTVCNHLMAQGFLSFSENPRHKRSKLASLTEKGSIAFQTARQKENSIIEAALPDITARKATDTCDLLKRIRMAVESISMVP